MRHGPATLLASTILGGCSLLYNPNNLPPPPTEAGIDARMPDVLMPADVNPDMLEVLSADQTGLTEGVGDEGSLPTILVLRGHHMTKANTMVSVTAFDGTTDVSQIVVDNTKLDVADTGDELAVPVKFVVDPTRGTGTAVRLKVSVTQMGAAGAVTRSLPDEVVFNADFLDELTISSPELVNNKLASGVHTYSRVEIAAGGLLAADTNAPLVVRATASIHITGTVSVNATNTTPGPGGAGGGTGGLIGSPATKGGGAGGGSPPSGGGGFGTMGGGTSGGPVSGDPALGVLGPPNQGSGGAGGSMPGGDGGAGGGTIELSAGGEVAIQGVTSNGGAGAAPGLGGTGGGGGSGGAILIRGRMLTAGAIAATGGAGGTGGSGGGGMGGSGRIRIDLPNNTAITTTPTAYRGPMFKPDTPLIVRNDHPMLTVFGEKSKPFSYVISNAEGTMTHTGTQTMGPQGTLIFPLAEGQGFFFGLNRVCLIVAGSDAASPPEAQNCVDIAYLYQK